MLVHFLPLFFLRFPAAGSMLHLHRSVNLNEKRLVSSQNLTNPAVSLSEIIPTKEIEYFCSPNGCCCFLPKKNEKVSVNQSSESPKMFCFKEVLPRKLTMSPEKCWLEDEMSF